MMLAGFAPAPKEIAMNARVPPSALNAAQALNQVSRAWDEQIVPQLTDYIGIPAKSPMFDADWAKHGYIDTVMRNTAAWVEAQKIKGLTLEIIRTEGRTPLMFFEVAASSGAAGGPAAVSQQTVLIKMQWFTGLFLLGRPAGRR